MVQIGFRNMQEKLEKECTVFARVGIDFTKKIDGK